MASPTTGSAHTVWTRQIDALSSGDLDELMKNYRSDAVLVRFDQTEEGIEAIREGFEAYLALTPEVIEVLDFVESDDVIFYRATMRLGGQVETTFGTLVLRDGLIWRQTAGVQV
ncbi:nuclear transport factor 2 family protein [Actinomadura fibrosa]|uniref:Nuclear transport factor 2 family protein n=1 Tax=Actinomadura fibrosa TaxID=111802 RepID=A0ABW2XSA4_9ACTN|nr:nuclear transport factor 2 family protein [Actinomadura fibrosa]